MDTMMILLFVVANVVGVVLMAVMLKVLNVQDEVAEREEAERTPDAVPLAETIAAEVPAFFGRPLKAVDGTSTFAATDRLPRIHEIDGRHIRWALGRANGNRAMAAMLLGLSETIFDASYMRYCGASGTAERAIDTRESLEDRLFAFVQNHIQAEQAMVNEFILLPSIDSLYRPAGVSLSAR
jgi:hypothetical protein